MTVKPNVQFVSKERFIQIFFEVRKIRYLPLVSPEYGKLKFNVTLEIFKRSMRKTSKSNPILQIFQRQAR